MSLQQSCCVLVHTLVPDIQMHIAIYLSPIHLKNFLLVCRRIHQVCSSERFWEMKYARDYPFYAAIMKESGISQYSTCHYHQPYKLLHILPSLESSQTCPYFPVRDWDVDEEYNRLADGGIAFLTYPAPPFDVKRERGCSWYRLQPDITIRASGTHFDLTQYHRSTDIGYIPVLGQKLPNSDCYDDCHVRKLIKYEMYRLLSILLEAKNKGYLLQRKGPGGVKGYDIEKYRGIFCPLN